MALMARIISSVRAVLGRRLDRDMDDEWQFHIAARVEALKAEGVAHADAEQRARTEFGDPLRWKEEGREARGQRWAQDLSADVRYALRQMRRAPGFTAVALVTLALGIGANTAIFSLLDAVVLKPLPFPAANELEMLYESGPDATPDTDGGSGRYFRFSYPRFNVLQQALGSGGALAGVTRTFALALRLPDGTRYPMVQAQLVSGNYFATLGVSAARGRAIMPDDVGADGESPVAVISDALSRRIWGGPDGVVGRRCIVNGTGVTIIGVAPPDFGGLWTDSDAQIWLPVTLQSAVGYNNNSSTYGTGVDLSQSWISEDRTAWLNLFARISPANLPRSRAVLDAANHQRAIALAQTLVGGVDGNAMSKHTLAVEPLTRGFSGLRARYSDALFVLTGIVGLVLLVSCANIANLMLVRAAGHTRELAVRISLGASTGRLVRQQLTESVVLASIGGAAGYLLGESGSARLARDVLGTRGNLPLVFTADRRVLAFTAGVSIATALVFGIVPALRAIGAGRSAARGINQRSNIGGGGGRGMAALVAGQLAMSLVVVFAAVLLARTFINFASLEPGFDVDHLVSTTFSPDPREPIPSLHQRLLDAALAVPGVRSAVLSRCGLVAGCSSSSGFFAEGGKHGAIQRNFVGPGYFSTVGIPVIAGREFDARDMAPSRVAVISESVARQYFNGVNPIGQHIGVVRPDSEIVGVVRDARSITLHDEPIGMVYQPLDEQSFSQLPVINLDVRASGQPDAIVPLLRESLQRTVPTLAPNGLGGMSTRLARDLSRERVVAYLASSFGVLALVLSALGLYGVLSYRVARRTQEIGVRMALGARRSQVLALVLRQGAVLTVLGIVVGLAGAAATAHYIQGLLFGLSPLDRSTLAGVAVILVIVATLASIIPARRATKVDPLVALRYE